MNRFFVSNRSGQCSLWGTNWSPVCNVTVVSIAIAHVGNSAMIHVFECRTAGCIEKVPRLISWVGKNKRPVGTQNALRAAVLLSYRHYDMNMESSAPKRSPLKFVKSYVMVDPAHHRRSSTPVFNFLPLWPLKQFTSHDLTFNIQCSTLSSDCLQRAPPSVQEVFCPPSPLHVTINSVAFSLYPLHPIIITLGISFMQGIYTYIPETNHVPREHCVATILM
jgi:hypothetical protein